MANEEIERVDVEEVVDLEEWAAAGRQVPRHCGGFRFRVNGERHVVREPTVGFERIVELAGFEPGAEVCVRVRVRGKKPHVLAPREEVDLTSPGIERFQVSEHCVVEVKLNNTEFELAVPSTGAKVKAAAIAAGARIKPDFVLFLVLEDGQTEQVGDDEVVYVDKGACFKAVDSDDNS